MSWKKTSGLFGNMSIFFIENINYADKIKSLLGKKTFVMQEHIAGYNEKRKIFHRLEWKRESTTTHALFTDNKFS